MSNKQLELAIHTVFLPREDLFFIKEWLAYHLHLGVDHFYLYDNTGSIGRFGSTPRVNKRQFDFYSLTKGLDDDEVREVLKRILAEHGDKCTLIDWQPENDSGQIIYGQADSIRHCVENFSGDVKWLAAIDMDEYLFSPAGKPPKEFIKSYCDRECSRAVIFQKKFADRYLNLDRYVIEIEDCIEGIDTNTLGPKNIFLTDAFDPHAEFNVHNIPVLYGKTCCFDQNLFRFNHYNASEWSLKWMQGYFKSDTPLMLNAIDKGMRPYRDIIHAACKTFGTPDWRRAIIELDPVTA